MTKDEIIDGALKQLVLRASTKDVIEGAMDEYAKQQAIAFMCHCLEDGYLKPDENGSVQLDYNYWHESNFTKASEEIYTKFIEQQNKE